MFSSILNIANNTVILVFLLLSKQIIPLYYFIFNYTTLCILKQTYFNKKKEELWTNYFTIEKGIYEKILSNPTEVVEGTVKELAEKYGTEVLVMTGFLDGINESLKGYENPIDTMAADTVVKIEIDPETL